MEEQMEVTAQAPVEVVDIQFRPGQKVYYFDPAGLRCRAGDHVIIDTARGAEYGYCTAGNHMISQREVVAPLRPVLRLATAQDSLWGLPGKNPAAGPGYAAGERRVRL